MDLILVYRMVIMDIIVMLFLLIYGLYCKKYDEDSVKFIPFAIVCLVYSVLGLVTEITVNASELPEKINDICHILYFTFGLLFSFVYFKYVLELVVNEKLLKRLLVLAGVLCALCISAMLFADIEYVQGAGTRYSQGLGPTLCYALGFLLIIISDAVIIANKKSIESSVWYTLMPSTIIAIVLLVIQIIYPLFLFSESAIVLICLGTFFAIEDPVGRFRKNTELFYKYAYIDGLTGLLNRRAYGEELGRFSESVPKDIVCISIDLNGLKKVNDNVGHEAGDELLVGAANLVSEAFGKYGKVYRTGGDEFYGIIRASREKYNEAYEHLLELCDAWSGEYSSEMSFSVGSAFYEDTPDKSIKEITVLADQRMYAAKAEHYRTLGEDRTGQAIAHKALCDLYAKILKINLTDDSYTVVNMDISEQTEEKGYSNSISTWLRSFGETGQVHPDDLREYYRNTNLDYMREYFASDKTSLHIFYKRRFGEDFKLVMMEIIPADDYSDDDQNLFLYVKNIEK